MATETTPSTRTHPWVDRHGRRVVALALIVGSALLASTFFSGTRRVGGRDCSYAIHWTTTRWHWVVMLSGVMVAWFLAFYVRRLASTRTRTHTGLLAGASFVAASAWCWYIYAAFMWPVLNSRTCVFGRPLRVRGTVALPSAHRRNRSSRIDVPKGLSHSDRVRIGKHWLECARGEYASVPAFTRLAAQLAAVDAPSHLIARAERSAREERVHADRTLDLAERMLGRSFALEFDESLPMPGPMTIADLAVESLIDGCLNEGCAAREARLRLSSVDDAATAAVLEMIAVDEQAHAELGWEIVAWAINAGPTEVTVVLRNASFPPARSGFALPPNCDHGVLRNFGWFEPAVCEQAHALVVDELASRLDALLDSDAVDRSARTVLATR